MLTFGLLKVVVVDDAVDDFAGDIDFAADFADVVVMLLEQAFKIALFKSFDGLVFGFGISLWCA